MISVQVHVAINLGLNCLLFVLVLSSVGLDYFRFLVRDRQDYRVGLATITHRLRFEDVQGDVYASFLNFRKFACSSSQDDGILTVCSNLLNFQFAGGFYIFIILPVSWSILFCCLNLSMLLFARGNFVSRFWYPHLVNAGAYVIAAGGFLLISNVDGLRLPGEVRVVVSSEAGIPLMFLTAGIAIIALFHYLYLKKYRNLHKLEIAAKTLVQKFLGMQETPEREGVEVTPDRQIAELSQQVRKLESADQELKVLRNEYERLLRAKTPSEDALAIASDRKGQEAGQRENEEQDVRFEDAERDTFALQLDRISAEKAMIEKTLQTTTEKLARKKSKLAQARNSVQDLQATNQKYLSDAASSQGIDQIKRLLEDEKRKELDNQKTLYSQQILQLEDDLKTAQGNVAVIRQESNRKDGVIAELERKLKSLESRLSDSNSETDSLKLRLRELEQDSSERENFRSKFEMEQRRSSLLKEQTQQLESMLKDMGQTKSEQLENLKRLYEDNYRKEIDALKDVYSERESNLKTENERVKGELRNAMEKIGKMGQELTEQFAAVSDAERAKKQLEDVSARLVHAETQSKQAQDESTAVRRKLQSTEDELQLTLEKVRSIQDLNARMLEEMETRHAADKERLKQFYDDTQGKEMEEHKKFYEQKLAKLNADLIAERGERIQTMDKVTPEPPTEGSQMENERLKEAYMKSFQIELEGMKDMYESSTASLKAERDRLREENAALSDRYTDLMRDKGKFQKEAEMLNAELQAEVEVREKLGKQLTDLKGRFEETQHDLDEANRLLESYKHSEGNQDLLTLFETQIKELNHAKAALESNLDSVQQENRDFQQELKLKEAEIQGLREEYMQVHKELFDSRERGSRPSGDRTEERSQSSTHSVKETMVIEGMTNLHGQNPILEKIALMKREAPMTYSNVWKLFESLLQEKVRLDRLEMSMGRQPRTMTEFMLDFMYLHYGLKTLALKQLKALVMSLQDLYKTSHMYGVLFCRFLGLFHPRPLPHHLAIYLLLVHEEFDILSTKVKIRRSESFAEQYDILQFGGQASIIDAMELVIRICKKNRSAGERIIAQLLPEQEASRIDLILLKVCGTMARMGRDPSYIFELLDRDRGGSIDYHEFVDGIRYNLNIWVSQEEAEDLCTYINDRGTGDITYEEWTQKVSFKEYSDKLNSKAAMVTKAALLSALIEEYEYEVVQDYYTLRHMIKMQSLDAAAAAEILWQIDPSLDDRTVGQLYEEAIDYEKDFAGGISPEALCIVVLRNRVGGFGVGIFGKSHIDVATLDQSLPKTATEGALSELVVENRGGDLQVDIMRRTSPT